MIGFFAMAVTLMFWGATSDRFGARPVLLTGAVSFSLCLWFAGRAPSVLLFQLSFTASRRVNGGFLRTDDGHSDGLVYHTAQPCSIFGVGGHGNGAGDDVAPRGPLIGVYDWRMVLTILSRLVAGVTIFVSLLLRCPPEQPQIRHAAEAPSASITVGQAVASPQFISLLLTNFSAAPPVPGRFFIPSAMSRFISPRHVGLRGVPDRHYLLTLRQVGCGGADPGFTLKDSSKTPALSVKLPSREWLLAPPVQAAFGSDKWQ